MKAPEKIFVGITDGKHYSIVGEGYPNAKERIRQIEWLRVSEKNNEFNENQ